MMSLAPGHKEERNQQQRHSQYQISPTIPRAGPEQIEERSSHNQQQHSDDGNAQLPPDTVAPWEKAACLPIQTHTLSPTHPLHFLLCQCLLRVAYAEEAPNRRDQRGGAKRKPDEQVMGIAR